ncbi:MAG: hypothetical protein ACKVJX_25150 [Verrucomicrobiia bacterium]|jgi:hypothetical protein
MNDELSQIRSRVQDAFLPGEFISMRREIGEAARMDAIDLELLCSIGAPRIGEREIEFNLLNALPTLRELTLDRFPPSADWPMELICFNDKYDFVYGLDNREGGNVKCVDLSGESHGVIFINSNLRSMIGFAAECRLHTNRCQASDTSYEDSFEEALAWMSQLDPDGGASEWWQAVFEDMNTFL